MELLVTVDKKYLPPLQVMLTSLYINNPEEDFEIYLIHSGFERRGNGTFEKDSARGWDIDFFS